MDNIIKSQIQTRVNELKSRGYTGQVIINSMKEYMQYVILSFIYNNPLYSKWVMYGGTALRICYKLDRMSEDLDFQVAQKVDLNLLKENLTKYLINDTGLEEKDFEISIKTRENNDTDNIVISFKDLLKDLDLGITWTSLKLKLDVNKFGVDQFEQELIPISNEGYVFSIRTYPLGTLMASKLAAVFLRTERFKGQERFEYKGRDIYDTFWYLQNKVVPNISYLQARGLDFKNTLEVFDKLHERIGNLDDKALHDDLVPLFYNSSELEFWFKNWRQSFFTLLSVYSIVEVDKLENITVTQDFHTQTYIIRYLYTAKGSDQDVIFTINFSHYFLIFNEFKVSEYEKKSQLPVPEIETSLREGLSQDMENLVNLFYDKVEEYLDRAQRIVNQKEISTRFIRPTSDNYNPKEQVLVDRRLLLKAKLEDLL